MTRLVGLRPFLTLAALALLAPFALFPTPTRFVALLALPVLWLWRWRVTRLSNPSGPHFIPRTPLDGAIFWIALMVLVSLYATFDIAFSLPKIAGLVYGIAVFYATVDVAVRSRRLLAGAIGLFLLMGFALACLALVGVRWPVKYAFLGPVVARLPAGLRGVPGAEAGFHGNEVAGALLWFLPLAVAVAVGLLTNRTPSSGRGHWRDAESTEKHNAGVKTKKRNLRGLRDSVVSHIAWLTTALAALLMAGVLVLTQSRGGLGGLLVGLLGMLAFLGWWGRGVVAAAVAAAVVFVVRLGPNELADILLSRIETEAFGTIYLTGRLELWSRALYGIQDFPFTGMGMNTFRRVVHVLYPLFETPSFLENDIGHAHNHLLQVALDLGLPGLVAYIALYGLAFFILIRVLGQSRDRTLRVYALGIFGGLLAYFVYGITDTVALGAKPGAAFWWLLALAVAVWRRATGTACARHVA